jgi:hypothetical protein
MDNLIQNGSIVGIALLFVNMAVFSQISSRTKAQRGDYDTMDQELNQWLGDASKNPVLNFVVALTGGGGNNLVTNLCRSLGRRLVWLSFIRCFFVSIDFFG